MRRVVIIGAGGRDFHVFNTVFREDPDTRVVAFTAAQIPGIDDRTYPAALAGPHYPDGIPIVAADADGSLAHYPGDTLQALHLFDDFGEALGDVATVPRGLFLVAVSLLALQVRLLPRWTGWFGLFVGAASLAALPVLAWPEGPIAVAWFVGLFGFLLWAAAVAVICGVRVIRGRRA